ncbi:hypothetical protein [Microlunatus antarcticus]|uniref:Uncharacterized protein n=1 Tax=Microlunatus antarcticus TaxID=53388 RepID=A0A7W5P6D4_9ACTN|nr:hypothetical protein [Microlunatus antarcticus]MBB3326404.1 hypothetical protein [Microlunatus antarcticus]
MAAGCGVPTTTTTPEAGASQPTGEQTLVAPVDPIDPSGPTGPAPSASEGPGTTSPAPVPLPSGSASTGDQPVATRPGSFDKDKVVATLYPVRRTGQTASVNLYIAAQDPDGSFMLLNSLGDGNTETSSKALTSVDGVRLVDPVAKKAYLPAVTADGQCVCSPDDGATGEVRSSVWVTVTFAAPPAELTMINVTVPTFGTFTDVPVR